MVRTIENAEIGQNLIAFARFYSLHLGYLTDWDICCLLELYFRLLFLAPQSKEGNCSGAGCQEGIFY